MSSEVHDRSLTVYLLVALGLPWLIVLPLWTGDGLDSPSALVLMSLMMITPTLAAVVALRAVERDSDPIRALLLKPTRPVWGFIGWLLLAHALMLALVVGALFTGAAFGVFPLDVVEFSGLRDLLQTQFASAGQLTDLSAPMWVFALASLPGLFLGSVINTVVAAGEELGWRAFLFPRLLVYGRVVALLAQGAIWGLWHAPVILLGYNYGDIPGWLSIALMCGFCTVVGAVLAWLTERTRTIWPAAMAHGTINAAVSATAIALGRADTAVNPVHATIMGWSGWILPGLLGLALWWFWPPSSRPDVMPEATAAQA